MANIRKVDSAIRVLQNHNKLYGRSCFKYQGEVISRTEAQSIIFYLQRYIEVGSFRGLISPVDGVQRVIEQIL